MVYQVELSPRAARDLKKLPKEVRQRLQKDIEGLATNPRPRGVVKLQGEENAYRIRVGDYRILYEIHDRVLLVILLKVGNRREVYR